MKLCVSRVTEDPRGLVEPTDPKERRWDWDRPIKCDSVGGGGGGGEEISLNEDIVIFTLGGVFRLVCEATESNNIRICVIKYLTMK